MSGGAAFSGLAAGGISSAVEGGINYCFSQAQAGDAWRRQKRILQNQIQWKVADLKKAGLNPILAAGSALGGSGSAPMASAKAGSVAGGTASATGAYKGKAEKELAESQALTNAAQASALRSTARLNIEKQITELFSQDALRSSAEQNRANARYRNTENGLLALKMPEASALGEYFKSAEGIEALRRRESGIAGTLTGQGMSIFDMIRNKWNDFEEDLPARSNARESILIPFEEAIRERDAKKRKNKK